MVEILVVFYITVFKSWEYLMNDDGLHKECTEKNAQSNTYVE